MLSLIMLSIALNEPFNLTTKVKFFSIVSKSNFAKVSLWPKEKNDLSS
jgi:hypothetical protein